MESDPDNLPEVLTPDESQHHDISTDVRNKGIPIENLIHYHNKGLNNTEIAKLVNCDPSNVSRRLQAAQSLIEQGKNYANHKSQLSNIRQSIYNNSIIRRTEKEIDQHSIPQLETAMAIAQDKGDKEDEKHTEPESKEDMRLSLEELERKEAALLAGADSDD